jgi:hypothetical protein
MASESQSMIAQALKNLLPTFSSYNTDGAQHPLATKISSLPYMMAAQPSSELLNVSQLHPDLAHEPNFSKLQHLMMYNNV